MTIQCEKISVLLLKTKSVPADGYEEYFATLDAGRYAPIFVPVLEHRFNEVALRKITTLIADGGFVCCAAPKEAEEIYGGVIFTSQRAVEAFANIVDIVRQSHGDINNQLPPDLPLYAVGPATAKGLRSMNLQCSILGEETGNGEALAAFMLNHYNHLERHSASRKAPLLFLVGEQRRDIIPRTLRSSSLPYDQRIRVEEMTIYETGVMESFSGDFVRIIEPNLTQRFPQWIVVFSPTGCKAMLEGLGFLDVQTGKVDKKALTADRTTFIATIGPTTRDYLIQEFDFEPDICALKPSAEGIGEAIRSFRLPKFSN